MEVCHSWTLRVLFRKFSLMVTRLHTLRVQQQVEHTGFNMRMAQDWRTSQPVSRMKWERRKKVGPPRTNPWHGLQTVTRWLDWRENHRSHNRCWQEQALGTRLDITQDRTPDAGWEKIIQRWRIGQEHQPSRPWESLGLPGLWKAQGWLFLF